MHGLLLSNIPSFSMSHQFCSSYSTQTLLNMQNKVVTQERFAALLWRQELDESRTVNMNQILDKCCRLNF